MTEIERTVWLDKPMTRSEDGRFQIVEGSEQFASSLTLTVAQGEALLELLAERFPARDARVKAEALDAEVEALRGYTLDHRSAEVIFDHLIRLIERDAAMLREQAKR